MWSPDRYKRALDFAAEAHRDQRVPGTGFPYVVHLAKVAMEVMTACASDPTLDADLAVACAILHDCVEDAGVTQRQIEAAFGPEIASGVAALTKDPSAPKAVGMKDSLDRIRAQPREVWVVKLADRITNLEPPPSHWSADKRTQYRVEAQQIRERLRGGSDLLEHRLEAKIAAYGEYCRDPA